MPRANIREEPLVKHMRPMTHDIPGPADKFQEFICAKNEIIADLLDAVGGEATFVTYIRDKCNLPENGETTS